MSAEPSTSRLPHVVIIGGGFGGLAAAQCLSRAPVRVTLIDRRNHHLFQPLLYQVATAALSPSDIAEPLRSILRRQRNVRVRLAHVTQLDFSEKRIRLVSATGTEDDTESQWLKYDKLIVAVGVRHAYFGREEWESNAPGLKTLGDALDIRHRVLTAFERAEWAQDPEERRALLTFVVVGAGPTGVELAGALAEIAFQSMRRDFRQADTRSARVILVEGGPEVLGSFPTPLQHSARKQLESLGVEVRSGVRVTDVNGDGVTLGDEKIRAKTVVWAAGVQAPSMLADAGAPVDRVGRVQIQPDLTVPDHPDVFCIGDAAIMEQDGQTLPGVAPVALSQGRYVGKLLRHQFRLGRDPGPFRYFDKGHLATIGRSRAVGFTRGLYLRGFIAWLAWVFVHLLFLVTYRNRLVVLVKWAWAWFTFERASRLLWRDEDSAGGRRPPTIHT